MSAPLDLPDVEVIEQYGILRAGAVSVDRDVITLGMARRSAAGWLALVQHLEGEQ